MDHYSVTSRGWNLSALAIKADIKKELWRFLYHLRPLQLLIRKIGNFSPTMIRSSVKQTSCGLYRTTGVDSIYQFIPIWSGSSSLLSLPLQRVYEKFAQFLFQLHEGSKRVRVNTEKGRSPITRVPPPVPCRLREYLYVDSAKPPATRAKMIDVWNRRMTLR